MRVLVMSDIHANLTALQAVLTAAGEYDAVWCLGDLVGYGPDPNECIEVMASLPNLTCLLGNHDAAALGQIDLETFNKEARISAAWMQSTLTARSFQFLTNLREKIVLGQITLAHGSPRNPVWEYLLDKFTAALNFRHFDTQLCFTGHTHIPSVFIENESRREIEWRRIPPNFPLTLRSRAILNPGSVGQPRDRDPRASFALFDTQTNTWEIHRVTYDVVSVQSRIQHAGLPDRHAIRLSAGW